MKRREVDACVLGAGSAGYAAARTLAAAGARTAVIEGGAEVGGLCILRGCMPTKSLLRAAELREEIRHAEAWGIHAERVGVDLRALYRRKDALIEEFAGFRRQQLDAGRFIFLRGTAQFLDHQTVALQPGGTVRAGHFVIATGSVLAPPPLKSLVEVGYLSSDAALQLTRLPESLIVLGGGALAVEFAQFFARLGVRTTVVQRGQHLLRSVDEDVARELEAAFRREGIEVFTQTRLTECGRDAQGKWVQFEHHGELRTIWAEEIFHGMGREPATDGLCLDTAGVTTAGKRIVTDTEQRTSQPHIYAAGDCCGPYDIVHLAIQQGEIAAHNIIHPNQRQQLDDRLLMTVAFTDPQVARVGLTEQEASARGVSFVSAIYPFNDHGKAMILGVQEGFVKLIAHRETGEILGAACVGPSGGELIHEMMVAIAARMTVQQLARLPHYHPTLAEIWTYPAEELAGLDPEQARDRGAPS